jgi:myosin heavy subunit
MVGAADLASLEPLTEEAIIDNLHNRFKHDQIYVSIIFLVIQTLLGSEVLLLI